MHKWLPIKNLFVSIKIRPTNLVFELKIQEFSVLNEVSWATLNACKRILKWQPFIGGSKTQVTGHCFTDNVTTLTLFLMLTFGLSATIRKCFRPKHYTKTIF